MNDKLYACALLLAAGVAAPAEGLNKQHISAEAKWLIHVDCENLRQTQVGSYLLNEVVVPKATQAMGEMKLNVSNIIQQISSITAYGTDFKKGPQADGVLLINTDGETQKALEGLLVAQILANTNGPIQKLEDTDQAIYSFNHEIFISPQKNGPIVISKSQDRLESAKDLLVGKGDNLSAAKTFNEFLTTSNSLFVVAAAEAFNAPNMIPPQAKVLQMADSGSVALGERGNQVCLDISLRAKTAEVTQQIQQVIEGMVALVKLGQPEIPDVLDLAKSTKVTSADQLVTVSLEYPATKAIARLNDVMNPKPHVDKPARKKAKSKAKAKATVSPEKPADNSEKPAESSDKPAAEPKAEGAAPEAAKPPAEVEPIPAK